MRVCLSLLALVCLFSVVAVAQTTEFTYQGILSDNSQAANGNYDFEFALFDSLVGGSQVGSTLTRPGVAVSGGTFTVKLDFGSEFPGAGRWLEISVRQNGQPGFTTLSPRQPVTSTPYSVKSLNAENATNAAQLGGVDSSQFVITSDTRLSDARPPTPGSGDYIQNTTTPQASSNFSITGTGTADRFDAVSYFSIGGASVVRSEGENLFVGWDSGTSNTSGSNNSFFGKLAGNFNTTGIRNSYFGTAAGWQNTSGGDNSFFGTQAGASSVTGFSNSFFGSFAGLENTGSENTFVGSEAGRSNTTGNRNTFVGQNSGGTNTFGGSNTFMGYRAGISSVTGSFNTSIGYQADVGSPGLTYATAIGSGSVVSTSNTIQLGRSGGEDTVLIFGPLSVSAQYNIGGNRVLSVVGSNNLFVGVGTGSANTSGAFNAFFGTNAGLTNTTGGANSFFGNAAGQLNTTGNSNSFFGGSSGSSNTMGIQNSFFGRNSGSSNATGNFNAFFGNSAGSSNTTGADNAFFGHSAGASNTTGSNNTIIGRNADVASADLTYATAIGSGAIVSTSDTIQLGRAQDTVRISGALSVSSTRTNTLYVTGLDVGFIDVCAFSGVLRNCVIGLQNKSRVRTYTAGLNVVRQLRPITFYWNQGGMRDVGFGAEEVEKIEPLLTTYNDKGEVEGVKYKQITTVLVNAVNEQQAEIEELNEKNRVLNERLKALEAVVCELKPEAAVCSSKKKEE